jgi:hypothetical protein
MSYHFFTRKTVVGRKDHRCEHCRKTIETGESHLYCAGKFEGEMMAYREHADCYKAWQELNETLRDNRWDDSHAFLADDDDIDAGERGWLREKHPAVAARLFGQEVEGGATAAVSPALSPAVNQPTRTGQETGGWKNE